MAQQRTLVIASRNPGKVVEIKTLLTGLPWDVHGLDQYLNCPEIPEDGATYEQNSALKATAAARHTGALTLGDDSGLEIEALDGLPGVHSSRWRGATSDQERVANILQELAPFPDPAQRTARFVCVITLADPTGVVPGGVLRGECRGCITGEPRGTNGFGYDPVFIPDGLELTFAQMPPDQKHQLSHRGKALAALRRFLSARAYAEPETGAAGVDPSSSRKEENMHDSDEDNIDRDVLDVATLKQVLEMVLREHEGFRPLAIHKKWQNGTLILQPADSSLAPKEIPIDTFIHKIIMVRERLRVLEQKINNHPSLDECEKFEISQYITRAYGSLTTFNTLLADRADHFKGASD